MKPNLAALSKEEKLRLYDAIQEKRRRILEKRPVYKPNAGQLPVHEDLRDIRIVQSGNGAGKSTLAVHETMWWARGVNPILGKTTKVPATIAVVLDKPDKVEDIWVKELSKWMNLTDEATLNKNGKPYVEEIIFKNGSKIQFYFHDQRELSAEGIEIDYAVFDEPPPRLLFVGLTRGTRKKGSEPKILIIGTPIAQPWVYEMLWKPAERGERPDIGIYRFATDVNRANLAEGYIERYSKNLTEAERAARIRGIPSHLEGLGLAHLFDRTRHVVPKFPWPQGKPVVLVIDPAQAKPHTAILVGATGDGRIYYLKEMRSRSTPAKFAAEIKEFYKGYRVIDYVIDSLGETPGTGGDGNMSFSEKLRQCGVPVRSTTFDDKKDEDFINRIKQVLETPDEPDNFGRRIPRLAIVEGNPGIIEDVETVSWQRFRHSEQYKPRLDTTKKDFLSCLKYALATNIAFMAETGKLPKVKRSRPSPWGGRRGR